MMLRRENDELQILKAQVQEMAQEIAHLKCEIKLTKDAQSYIPQDLGRGFGKTIGRSMLKQQPLQEVFNNKVIFRQLVKEVSIAVNSRANRNFFGDE